MSPLGRGIKPGINVSKYTSTRPFHFIHNQYLLQVRLPIDLRITDISGSDLQHAGGRNHI